MKVDIITKKISEWPALVYFDADAKLYTIIYNGEHGAVISDADYKTAKKKFTEAMQLAEAIKKLSIFRKNYYNEKL